VCGDGELTRCCPRVASAVTWGCDRALVTRSTHAPATAGVRARRRHGRLRRRVGGDTGFRVRQAALLAGAVAVTVAASGVGAQAALTPHGAHAPHVATRVVQEATLRALQAAKFSASSAGFGRAVRHHESPSTPTSLAPTTSTLPPVTTTTAAPATPYPFGVVDPTEPSGMAPPTPDAMAGYAQSYVTDFAGTSLPPGWEVFTGQPGGDPGAQWGAAHVTVSDGTLSLNTWKDPAYNDEWVAGGLCQCGVVSTYGAYFVRSRVTGPGPTQVELLWPTHGWPPEVDFDETSGATTWSSATLHWGAANNQDQRRVSIDMTQWHTWGVIWTATSVLYTVDGRVWGSVNDPSEISSAPMTLDLTQQTWCSSFSACPSAPQSTQVDWVAEYTSSS
jgi:hypothetical protein